jgi:leucyl/phenylalanyl-tRNA--protein transferase
MRGCAGPRGGQDGTWITNAVQRGYLALFERGFAHSVESWRDGQLVGGLYGVAIGRMFFGESMFASEPDASKVALAHLVRQLRAWNFPMIDCQQETAHLASLGARPIPRGEFAAALSRLVHCEHPIPLPQHWTFDP